MKRTKHILCETRQAIDLLLVLTVNNLHCRLKLLCLRFVCKVETDLVGLQGRNKYSNGELQNICFSFFFVIKQICRICSGQRRLSLANMINTMCGGKLTLPTTPNVSGIWWWQHHALPLLFFMGMTRATIE